MISLTPGPRHSDLSSCALAREEPLCHWLAASIPTVRGARGARPGGWHWQQVPLPSLQCPLPPTPSARAQGPQKGSCGLCYTGLAWPRGPLPPPIPPSPGWARPHLPRTRGEPAWTGRAAQREGPGGASPRHSRPVRVPPGLSSPRAPRPVSATAHGALPPAPPAACPLVPVALPCVVSRPLPDPPPPGAGLAHPPLPSTLPGAFLCRFLNVILKSGK